MNCATITLLDNKVDLNRVRGIMKTRDNKLVGVCPHCNYQIESEGSNTTCKFCNRIIKWILI